MASTSRSISLAVDAGRREAPLGRGDGHVAGRHLGRRVAALADAGALNDPLGVAAERRERLVGDDVVGQEAARADDLHAGQPPQRRASDADLKVVAHD